MKWSKLNGLAGLLGASVLLAACSSMPSMNKLTGGLFQKEEEKLPGKRVAVLKSDNQLKPTAASVKVALPAPSANPAWSQPGGDAANAPGHLAFSGSLSRRWVADAGSGSSSDGQLIARPVAFGGRIYTLDTRGRVTAFSAGSGSVSWRTSLTPESEEKSEGYGGGLAVDSGRLYATTGYGTVVAMEPSTGKILWSKDYNAPIRVSPTAAKGKVFAVTVEGRLYCLNGADGEEIWAQRGLPEKTSILSNTSPAVSGNVVVVPYSSGEITAYNLVSGRSMWTESLSGPRTNSIISAVSNPGRPAIRNGVVYAAGNSGRMIATSQKDGERVWNNVISSTETPWPAGNMVYVVDTSGRAMALSLKSGEVVWVTKLPEESKWSGPVLAGGRLWYASGKGKMVGVNPTTGKIATQRDIGYRINIAPIVAAGHMYILSDNAKLIALN